MKLRGLFLIAALISPLSQAAPKKSKKIAAVGNVMTEQILTDVHGQWNGVLLIHNQDLYRQFLFMNQLFHNTSGPMALGIDIRVREGRASTRLYQASYGRFIPLTSRAGTAHAEGNAGFMLDTRDVQIQNTYLDKTKSILLMTIYFRGQIIAAGQVSGRLL